MKNLDEAKRKIAKQGAEFVVHIIFLNKDYVQAIKFIENKIQYLYYEITEDDVKIVTDQKILIELRKKYEMKPSNINYLNTESYYNKEQRKPNEELKNWIKKFVQNELGKYKTFAKVYGDEFVKERMETVQVLYTLELAIGEKSILKLGKGKSLHKILKMSEQEAIRFISIGDRVLQMNEEILELENVIKDEYLNHTY